MAPINVIVYYPKTPSGQDELAHRVADAHASAVIQRIQSLNCSTKQKLDLLDAVIASAKSRSCRSGTTQDRNYVLDRDR